MCGVRSQTGSDVVITCADPGIVEAFVSFARMPTKHLRCSVALGRAWKAVQMKRRGAGVLSDHHLAPVRS